MKARISKMRQSLKEARRDHETIFHEVHENLPQGRKDNDNPAAELLRQINTLNVELSNCERSLRIAQALPASDQKNVLQEKLSRQMAWLEETIQTTVDEASKTASQQNINEAAPSAVEIIAEALDKRPVKGADIQAEVVKLRDEIAASKPAPSLFERLFSWKKTSQANETPAAMEDSKNENTGTIKTTILRNDSQSENFETTRRISSIRDSDKSPVSQAEAYAEKFRNEEKKPNRKKPHIKDIFNHNETPTPVDESKNQASGTVKTTIVREDSQSENFETTRRVNSNQDSGNTPVSQAEAYAAKNRNEEKKPSKQKPHIKDIFDSEALLKMKKPEDDALLQTAREKIEEAKQLQGKAAAAGNGALARQLENDINNLQIGSWKLSKAVEKVHTFMSEEYKQNQREGLKQLVKTHDALCNSSSAKTLKTDVQPIGKLKTHESASESKSIANSSDSSVNSPRSEDDSRGYTPRRGP